MSDLINVSFQDKEVPIVERNGVLYVAIKPICENIGLDWHAQRQRINRDEVLSEGKVIITAP